MNQTYRIFTDGSAIGNPGPGGWGAVVMLGKRRWEMSGAFPWTTISAMELVAAVQALRSLPDRARVELLLHEKPEQASQLEYVRTHTGFCRRIVVTPEDIQRVAG